MLGQIVRRRDNERAMRQTVPIHRRDLHEERALIERLPFSCCVTYRNVQCSRPYFIRSTIFDTLFASFNMAARGSFFFRHEYFQASDCIYIAWNLIQL